LKARIFQKRLVGYAAATRENCNTSAIINSMTNPRYASIETLRPGTGSTGAPSRIVGVVSVTDIVWLTVAIKPLRYKLVQAYTESVRVEQTYAVVKMEG
jgi:hypothetical protein